MIEDDYRNTLYQDYTASLLRNLCGSFISFAGGTVELPSFIEMVYPKTRVGQMTAEEIKERTYRLFSGKEG